MNYHYRNHSHAPWRMRRAISWRSELMIWLMVLLSGIVAAIVTAVLL